MKASQGGEVNVGLWHTVTVARTIPYQASKIKEGIM